MKVIGAWESKDFCTNYLETFQSILSKFNTNAVTYWSHKPYIDLTSSTTYVLGKIRYQGDFSPPPPPPPHPSLPKSLTLACVWNYKKSIPFKLGTMRLYSVSLFDASLHDFDRNSRLQMWERVKSSAFIFSPNSQSIGMTLNKLLLYMVWR